MSEPTITCPNCKTEIRLTESLAAPLIEATRQKFAEQLAQKDRDVATKEQALKEREEALETERQGLDDEVAGRMREERAKIAAAEAAKARLLVQDDIDQSAQKLKELEEVLKERNVKLAEAQKAQADLMRKERALEDAQREMDLTIQKTIQEGLGAARDQAKKEAEDELKLKVMEKEQTITAMQKQIEELRRKAEQGSQQLQGDVQEVELEGLLKARFPLDDIERVPKGEHGGDVTQTVKGQSGYPCGKILWESKRTRNWSDGWLPKLREDQRAAKADIAVIISKVLPPNVESFELVDHVWVAHPGIAVAIATVLRQTLIEVAVARQASEGQQTKMEVMYQYLTGPRFRQRVQAIVEAFSNMQQDLDKERKAITKQWAKREAEISRVMQATVGMYGDLEGIAGKTMPEIEGLELPALEDGSGDVVA